MLVGGQLGKVLSCPEHPGRFYGRGKTGPNTNSSRKNRKIGQGGGLGWGQKVVRHMPFSRLRRSYSRSVLQLGKAQNSLYIYGRLGSQARKAQATRRDK